MRRYRHPRRPHSTVRARSELEIIQTLPVEGRTGAVVGAPANLAAPFKGTRIQSVTGFGLERTQPRPGRYSIKRFCSVQFPVRVELSRVEYARCFGGGLAPALWPHDLSDRP